MKKIIFFLTAILLLALCACGSTQESDKAMQAVQSAYLELTDADSFHVVLTTEYNGKITSRYETWYANGDWMEESSERTGQYLWVNEQCISGGAEPDQSPETQVHIKKMLTLEKADPNIHSFVSMSTDGNDNIWVTLTDGELIQEDGSLKEGAWIRVYEIDPNGRLLSVEKTATIADGSVIIERLSIEAINSDTVSKDIAVASFDISA